MTEQAAEWFEKASEDLAAARVLIDAGQNLPALFHLQQCVEKSIKATLIAEEGEYPHTHRLLVLGRNAGIPDEYDELLSDLDVAYTAARYPDTGDFEVEEIDPILAGVEEVFRWTKRQ